MSSSAVPGSYSYAATSDAILDPHLKAVCRTAAVLFGARHAFVWPIRSGGVTSFVGAASDVGIAFPSATLLRYAAQASPGEPLVVLDSCTDPRFVADPIVAGALYPRFVAALPVAVADDTPDMFVCVLDPSPRHDFDAADRRCLIDIGLLAQAALRGRVPRRKTRPVRSSIAHAERRFRLLAENAVDVLVLGDFDKRVLYVSPAVRTVLGYQPDELVHRSLRMLVHPEDAHVCDEYWAKVLAADPMRGTCRARHRHRDGHFVWLEASANLATDAEGDLEVGFVATLRDVTARRETEDAIRHMALHDALTDLPNRTLFRRRLDQTIAGTADAAGSFAVLLCDLDRFKAVNDSLGHPAGDALLRIVAERMRIVLDPRDTVARLGGDEFAVLLARPANPEAVARLAERLIAAVSEPVVLDGRTVQVGVSVGLVVVSGGNLGADELFKRADIALYEAKAAGRNTHRAFCPDDGARVAARGRLGLEMKEAIRRGEFHLVYQPVVDAATGAAVSFEALMRWRHSSAVEVPPGEFIPLAEETGLIVPLGTWALREACREAATWPEGLRVGVNVSAVQFRGGLEEAVLSALAATGLPARRLKLEVTESVLMRDADSVLACLHRLRALGVSIALDDFGIGYSSLSYLRRFPFDKIKIDRSFIRDIADPDAAAIVRAVVGIGERLGMGIVAEGVETAEQLDLVRREGCSQVQGFLFSPPLSPEDARAYAFGQVPKGV